MSISDKISMFYNFTNDEIENNIKHIQNEIERICTERRSELQSPLPIAIEEGNLGARLAGNPDPR
jgi:transcriptional regulator with AAA-type ATPase domain